MSDLKTNLGKRWRIIVLLSLAFIIALIAQDVIREVIIFDNEIQAMEQEIQRDVESDVRMLVDSVDADFQSIVDTLHDDAVVHAEANITPLIFAVESFLELNEGMTANEIESRIVAMTQLYNNADEDHIYFVYDTSGMERYNGQTDELTNLDRSTARDDLDRPYVELVLDGVQESANGETVVSMFTESGETFIQTIIYARQIVDTDLILLSHVALDAFTQKQKDAAIASLSDRYRDAENSVYVLSGAGEILYHQNSDAVGLTPANQTYPLWADTLQLILDFIEEESEGLMTYDFYSNYVNGVIKEKIAYVTYLEDWDLIVGASADRDLYQAIFNQYIQDNYRSVFLVKLPAYVIILTLSVFIFIFVRNNVELSQRMLAEEEKLYRRFADLTSEIIMITNRQGQIIFTNKQGTEIIYGQRSDHQILNFDQILVEEDGYYILYGATDDYFVKFITEEIEYDNEPADLYLIADVTDKIQTERKLEALSLKDELTGLPNRRGMIKDYTEVILPEVKDGHIAHIAMIDLDDFKPANDLYGHAYGDEVLQDIAELFQEHISNQVRFYRVGGDEFALFFRDVPRDDIVAFLGDLLDEVSARRFEKGIRIGFSAGVAEIAISDRRRRFSDFFDEADKLLYQAKAEGKHCIRF